MQLDYQDIEKPAGLHSTQAYLHPAQTGFQHGPGREFYSANTASIKGKNCLAGHFESDFLLRTLPLVSAHLLRKDEARKPVCNMACLNPF
jgi:hypothetical protein